MSKGFLNDTQVSSGCMVEISGEFTPETMGWLPYCVFNMSVDGVCCDVFFSVVVFAGETPAWFPAG